MSEQIRPILPLKLRLDLKHYGPSSSHSVGLSISTSYPPTRSTTTTPTHPRNLEHLLLGFGGSSREDGFGLPLRGCMQQESESEQHSPVISPCGAEAICPCTCATWDSTSLIQKCHSCLFGVIKNALQTSVL